MPSELHFIGGHAALLRGGRSPRRFLGAASGRGAALRAALEPAHEFGCRGKRLDGLDGHLAHFLGLYLHG